MREVGEYECTVIDESKTIKKIIVYAPIPVTKWGLAVCLPVKEATKLKPIVDTSVQSTLFSIILACLAILTLEVILVNTKILE